MAKPQSGNTPNPDVDKKTAKGKGEGGFSPHPKDADQPKPYDPGHRPNVETPPIKPVGKKN